MVDDIGNFDIGVEKTEPIVTTPLTELTETTLKDLLTTEAETINNLKEGGDMTEENINFMHFGFMAGLKSCGCDKGLINTIIDTLREEK